MLEAIMALITDILTRVRPISFVRKLQLILVLITLIMITFFVASPYLGQERIELGKNSPFAIGNFAPDTVISNKEIIYEDMQKTNLERQKAYQSAAYIFERDFTVLNSLNSYINEDFDNLESLGTNENASRIVPLLKSKNPRWKKRERADLKLLLNYKRKDLVRKAVLKGTNLLFSTHCIMKDTPEEYSKMSESGGNIVNKGSQEKNSIIEGTKIFPRKFIYDKNKYFYRLGRILDDKIKLDPNVLPIVKRFVVSYIYSFPACIYNPEETEKEKLARMNKVPVVKSRIVANETVVKKGELITPEIKKKLEIINDNASNANTTSILSLLIIQVIFVSIIGFFLKGYDRRRLNDVSSNVVVFSMIWIVSIATYFISAAFYKPESDFESVYYFAIFVPIGMVGLLLSFIYDIQLSIAIGFYLSLFVFISSRYNPTSFFISFCTSIIASIYGRKLTKRIDFIKSGFVIAGMQMLVSTSGYLFDSRPYWVSTGSGSFTSDLLHSNIFKLYLICLINGFICTTAAQFLLPIYEYLFNIPTRFKLMELADTGHPLLQSLLTRAPSTYTHTFMVAAMSERAAQNLNLNWLLTRVGVYYHDIGKIPNAGFFIENQHLIPRPENVDKNNPSIAASVVIRHVTDGIEMAKKARLPREVIDFIPEHHGTSTMAFFYHKALADLTNEQRGNIKKSDFQYPGPKPQSKETAIVMIADSVEAASRSLDVVSSESVDELIQKIINIKLAESQLDESGLTIGDLLIIKSSFKEVLLSSLHSRPKYPKPEETKKLEGKEVSEQDKSEQENKSPEDKSVSEKSIDTGEKVLPHLQKNTEIENLEIKTIVSKKKVRKKKTASKKKSLSVAREKKDAGI